MSKEERKQEEKETEAKRIRPYSFSPEQLKNIRPISKSPNYRDFEDMVYTVYNTSIERETIKLGNVNTIIQWFERNEPLKVAMWNGISGKDEWKAVIKRKVNFWEYRLLREIKKTEIELSK